MYNTKARKRELLKYKSYKCEICGNKGYWNGKNLSLQIDHIDGNNKNNIVDNLRFLCPNCHSQTETFTGRNARTKNFNRPSKEEFIALASSYTHKEIAVLKAVSLRTVYQWFNFFIKEDREPEKRRPLSTRSFSCEQISNIRKSNLGIRSMARELNVSHSLLKDIRKGRLYKDCN